MAAEAVRGNQGATDSPIPQIFQIEERREKTGRREDE
jgi:hypothetical protein